MIKVGENIKNYRKAKGITQEELAGSLQISYQAVSKWENGVAQPDIALIPQIANYFGVTIDELFGYKLNALTNKEKFIKFMANNSILKFDPWEQIESGKGGFYVNTENFTTNAQIYKVGEFFADCIRENNLVFDTILGLAYHGIGFSAATACALYNKYGITVNYCYDRKIADSRGRMICGHTIKDGERVVIIDDLISSGFTLIERVERIKETAKIQVAAIVVLVSRLKPGASEEEKTGAECMKEQYGADVYSIVTGQDILHAIKSGVITQKNYITER